MDCVEELYKFVCVARMAADQPQKDAAGENGILVKENEKSPQKNVTLKFAEDKAMEYDFYVISAEFLIEQIEEFLLSRRSVILLDIDKARQIIDDSHMKQEPPVVEAKKEPENENGLPSSLPVEV
jgi:hypothetical protein